MASVSKVLAACLCALVLAAGIALSATAGGGHSGGDSGKHQYGTKPSCKLPNKKGHNGYKARHSRRDGYAKDCPKYKPHHKKSSATRADS